MSPAKIRTLEPVLLDQLMPDLFQNSVLNGIEFSGIQSDSRRVQPGDLFVALSGERVKGQDYIAEAISRGAVAVISDLPLDDALLVPAMVVPGIRYHLGQLCHRLWDEPSTRISLIGITGTNGKTSCSQFIAQALTRLGTPCAVIGTLGYGVPGELEDIGFTTPDLVTNHEIVARLERQGARAIAMEVSSHGLDQGRIDGLQFEIAVFTNLSRDHLDYHGTMASYGASKERLFQIPGLKQAVINLDDSFAREMVGRLSPELPVLTYGIDNPAALVRVNHVEYSLRGVRAGLHTPWGEGILMSHLLGAFNLSNLLAVISVLCARSVSLQEALGVIAGLEAVPGRMETFGGAKLPLVVVDYAHTPAALESVLKTLEALCNGKLFCVFGCGGDRDAGKRPLMGQIAERWADEVWVTNDNPRHEAPLDIARQIVDGMDLPGRAHIELNREAAIDAAIQKAGAGDVVLVAGKGHENYHPGRNSDDRCLDAGCAGE